jgi:molybdopterin-guanine dinucleotide biosynthesis protein A
MGRDKALIKWRGQTAVARTAGLAGACGAEWLVVSGADYGLPCVADPPDSGPVGGFMAAAAAVRAKGAERLLVLAVDAPSIRAQDLAPLLKRGPPGAAFEGLPLPMVIEAGAVPNDVAKDWSLRRLVEAAGLTILPPPPGAAARLRGANTPQELKGLRLG